MIPARNITSLVLRLVVLAALALSGSATVSAGVTPQQVDSIFAPFTLPGSPGCVVAVIDSHRIVYSKAFGLANLEHDVPNTIETIFDIGSNAKQFTATAILLLEEEGILSIDDDVHKYIPELPAYPWPITLRHLLTHTSGIRDYFELMMLKGVFVGNQYPNRYYLDLICRQPELNFRSGEMQMYSNSGFILLAEIVRRVSGRTLAEFARERIFEPLGMTHTRFVEDASVIIPHRAASYGSLPSGGYWQGVSIATNNGDGGILSTLADLARWDRNFYDNQLGRKSPLLLRRLQEPFVLNSGDTIPWGLGLRLGEHHGLPVIFHGGAYFGFRSEILRFPDQQFTVIVLANSDKAVAWTLAYQVADLYLSESYHDEVVDAAAATPPSYQPDPRALTDKAGRYRNPISGIIWTVTPTDTTLEIATSTGFAFQLLPTGPDQFISVGIPQQASVRFERDSANAWAAIFTPPGQAPARLSSIPLRPQNAPLETYVGKYHCRELEMTISLLMSGEALSMQSDDADLDYRLTQLLPDEFSAANGGYLLHFIRGEHDQIAALAINSQRVKNLRFDRLAG